MPTYGRPSPQDQLVIRIRASLDEAGIPHAKGDGAGYIVQDGDGRIGINVRYVCKHHVLVRHEVKIDEIIAILKKRFHGRTVEIGSSRRHITVSRTGNPLHGGSEINVNMSSSPYL